MGRRRTHDRHLPERVYLRRGKYYFDSPVLKKWIPLGGDLAIALAKYAGLIGSWKGRSIKDTITRFRATVLPLKPSPQTREEYGRGLARLDAVFGHMMQDDVTHQHLYRYIDLRFDERGPYKDQKRPARTAAINEVELLGQVFAKGIRWGNGTVNAAKTIVWDEEDLPKRQKRKVSDEEFAIIHQLADVRMKIAIEVAHQVGPRRGDLLRIRREHGTAEGIEIPMGKTGETVLVEWTPALRDLWDRAFALKPDIPRDYLIRRRDGRPYTPRGFSANWQRLMRKATSPGKNGEPPLLAKRFKFHDIRRKAATDKMKAESLEEAQKLLGHLDPQTTLKHYITEKKPIRARPLR